MAFPFFGRLIAPFRRAQTTGVPSYGLIPPLGSVQSATGLLISQATAMTVAGVNRAVTVRANSVALCRPTLYAVADDGTHTPLKSADHPLVQLLKRPNRVQTRFEFIRDTWIALLLRGNAYWAIKRDRRGTPIELIWINPDAVMILEAVDGQWFYNVNRIGLFMIEALREFPISIPAEDIIHFRGPSFNMLVAASTIGLARDTIGLSMGQTQQQARWLGNGARPGVVLEASKPLSDAAAKRLKQSWEDYNAGIQNIGRTAVLEDGVTAKQMSLTSVDLEFVAQSNLTMQDIARFFGVPLRKLYQPDTSRGSTVIQEDQAFVNETVSPDLEMLEQKLDREFSLDEDGLVLDFDESPLLRADPKTRYDIGRIGVLSGLVAPNEFRKSERLPPVPDGDTVRAPVNLAALGSDMTGTAGDGAGRPANGEEPEPGVPTQGGGGKTKRDLPIALTINVEAAKPSRRTGTITRREDGSAELDLVEAAE
jgi:HK97 family phage portal protein